MTAWEPPVNRAPGGEAPGSGAPAHTERADSLTLQCRLSNRCVVAGKESRLRLLIEVSAAVARGRRPNLNVCLAIDRSFSMSEDHKLERAKEAALAFISSLVPTDTFSLVEFSTDVRVAVEARVNIPHDELQRAVMAIQPRGATNLHGALHAAGAEVMRGVSPGRLNRVILLSDGVPTDGITSDREILDVVRMARALGISITTIGLGDDYDEVLLSQVSEISGGNHYFVDAGEDIRRCLVREVGRMEALAARDLVLTVEPAAEVHLSLANTRYFDRCILEGGRNRVALDDMERGGVQSVLFTVEMPARPEGEFAVAAARLEYKESGRSGTQDSNTRILKAGAAIEARTDAAGIKDGIDREVLRRWEELDGMQGMADVVDRGRTGALSPQDVARTLHSTADRLTRVGSPRASLVSRIESTIVEQGEISSGLAKRTIIERMAAQQGDQPLAEEIT